ncbi:MAG: AI-2E family transporter [Elusimicrobiales bacterium]|jgi:predicted PurR-regulated permease PerM
MNDETGKPLKKLNFLKLDKIQLFNFFFFGILLYLLYQLLRILSPFLGALLVAGTLALIFYPAHLWIKRRITARNNLASALSTGVVLLTVVLPLLIFGWLLFKESRDIYPKTNRWLSNFSQTGLDLRMPEGLRSVWDVDAGDIVLGNIKNLQETIMKSGGTILKNIFFLFVNFMVIIATLFAFFRDGERLLHWLIDLMPMDAEHKYRIANQLYMTTIAVVRGILLTAALQGLTGAVGYALAGVPAPVLLGVLTSFAALIPFVGTSLIWLPLGVAFMFIKSFSAGVFLLLWGLLVIGLIDNIIRPILIGQKAKLPIFLLFLGIFGGLRVYGPIGIFMGPLLISCLIVFLQIYKEAKNLVPKEG